MVRGVTAAREWRTAFATSIGTSHQRTGTPCQDASACTVVGAPDGTQVVVMAVSDGAGRARLSGIGSAMAVEHFLERFSRAAVTSPDLAAIDRRFVDQWFSDVRGSIRARAEVDGADIADYACTLLGVVAGSNVTGFVQIGDGAIVVSTEEPREYNWVFWPQHGEYANSTFFVTQDGAEAALQFEAGAAVDEIAVFSDGIERLVLDMSLKTVHSPAFRPIFEWLAKTEPDRSGLPSDALLAYLGSEHVNKRTDDDKTLVMATRALPAVKV